MASVQGQDSQHSIGEELVDPSKTYSFVKDHAVSWYQYYDGDSEEEMNAHVSNGTIYVVTGVDRPTCWSTPVFPESQTDEKNNSFSHLVFKYKYIEGRERSPWQDEGQDIVQ